MNIIANSAEALSRKIFEEKLKKQKQEECIEKLISPHYEFLKKLEEKVSNIIKIQELETKSIKRQNKINLIIQFILIIIGVLSIVF